MEIIDDKVLISWIKSHSLKDNDRAFAYLYQEYLGLIQKIIITNSGDSQDAEDIFQDGLIVLYHQVKKGKLTLTCSLKTYLYSICRNLWLKKLRKSNRIVELSDVMQEYIPIEESQLKTLEHTEQKELIANYLDQLKADCKNILTYFYFEKIRMSEIAKRMGFSSEQGAKNKKSTCMKKLKALMKNSVYFKD